MDDLQGCCKRLREKDCFASAAMQEAITQALGVTTDEQQQIQLVPLLLAVSLGALRREIVKIQSSSEGALTVIDARK